MNDLINNFPEGIDLEMILSGTLSFFNIKIFHSSSEISSKWEDYEQKVQLDAGIWRKIFKRIVLEL